MLRKVYRFKEELCDWWKFKPGQRKNQESIDYKLKSVECKTLVNPIVAKGTKLEDKFLFPIFAAFCATYMTRLKVAHHHVLFSIVEEVKMLHDSFKCNGVINFHTSKMFTEAITDPSGFSFP